MKEYNNEAVSIGDCFLVESGANASGKKGEQLARENGSITWKRILKVLN